MAIGHLGVQPLALGRPAPERGHVGLGPGLVDEDEMPGIKPPLILAPLRAPPCDLGAQLFGGKNAFFLNSGPRPGTSARTAPNSPLTRRWPVLATVRARVKLTWPPRTGKSHACPTECLGF